MTVPAPASSSPADLRLAIRGWRRSHRIWVVGALLVVAAGWVAVTLVVAPGDADGAATVGTVRSLLTVAASAASLTLAVGLLLGHVGTARLRWPRHFARLPLLVRDVWRGADHPARPLVTGGLVGLVLALFAHPAVAVGVAVAAVGLTVTDVGLAVVIGADAAARAWRRAVALPREATVHTRRLGVVAAGLAAGVAGLGRLAAPATCTAERLLGATCGTSALPLALAAVVGGLVAIPLSLALGAVVSLTLDGHPLADLAGAVAPGPTPPPVEQPAEDPVRAEEPGGAPLPPPTADEQSLAAAAALAQVGAEAEEPEPTTSPGAGSDAHRVDTADATTPGVEALLEVLTAGPADRVRSVIADLSDDAGTIPALRRQYHRAPGIAKGAIERACISRLRAVGIEDDDARTLAVQLLELPQQDWETLLARLTQRSTS